VLKTEVAVLAARKRMISRFQTSRLLLRPFY